MNNSAIFSVQHFSENTALHTENTALCVTNFEPLKVEQFVNQKYFKPVKALPQYEKIPLGCGSQAQYSTWLRLMLYVLVSHTHTVVLFFPYCTRSGG